MKRIICVALLSMALAISAGNVNAQKMSDMPGQQMTGQSQQQSHPAGQEGQQQMQPGMMMGNRGMGMMAPGMMRNMMSGGMQPGMMMGSRGMMGPGMMGSMMGGSMHFGMMMSPMMCLAAGMDKKKIVQYEKFIQETKAMRKKLWDLRFEYGEALWNPNTTMKELWGMFEKINQLQKEIQQKMPR
jgi:hypothetical protein